jgi:hypothetical protein
MLYADLHSKGKVLMAKMGVCNWSIGVSGCDLRLLIQILQWGRNTFCPELKKGFNTVS